MVVFNCNYFVIYACAFLNWVGATFSSGSAIIFLISFLTISLKESSSDKSHAFNFFWAASLEICPKLYNILKEYPLKYNITTLVKYYNNNYEDNILTTHLVVYNTLKEFYGEEIDELLQYGFHSKEEIAFA